MFWYMIIRYFASRLKRKEYNWHKLDNGEFQPASLGGSFMPNGRPAYRQAVVFGSKKLN